MSVIDTSSGTAREKPSPNAKIMHHRLQILTACKHPTACTCSVLSRKCFLLTLVHMRTRLLYMRYCVWVGRACICACSYCALICWLSCFKYALIYKKMPCICIHIHLDVSCMWMETHAHVQISALLNRALDDYQDFIVEFQPLKRHVMSLPANFKHSVHRHADFRRYACRVTL
jgi:hypothetical protein